MAAFGGTGTLRDYTIAQLRDYDGVAQPQILVALLGDVYDVSAAAEHYSQGCPYHIFAGRDASRALAKMTFDETELSNSCVDDLTSTEINKLNEWVVKYRDVRRYPIVGRLSAPSPCRDLRVSELSVYRGSQEKPPGEVIYWTL